MAVKEVSVHANPPRGVGGSDPPDCLRCHCKPVGGSWVSNAAGAKRVPGDAEVRERRLNADSLKTRTRFGNLFEGYPGTAKAKG